MSDLNRVVSRFDSEFVAVEAAPLRAYFADLELRLIEHIRSADVVVGCVAWLTSPRILGALRRVPKGVSLIVQKEEFLRPDLDADSDGHWRAELHKNYSALQALDCWPGTLDIATHALVDELKIQPVRCVGMARKGSSTQPRMHHKFLVFCSQSTTSAPGAGNDSACETRPQPFAVWTGSFNFTVNGRHSLENAVFIHDNRIADAYYQEWQDVAWLSEPLNWKSKWIDQEWSVT